MIYDSFPQKLRVCIRFILPVILCLSGVGLFLDSAQAQAFPINSDAALQPAQGQWIHRTQVRWNKLRVDPKGPDADIDAVVNSHVLVYAWTHRFSTAIAIPLIYRDLDSPGADEDDLGIGDIKLLLRYKIWQRLTRETWQWWTVIAGLEFPTFDTPFSSRSFDPTLGTVYTWRHGKHGLDVDFLYQINTENDRDFEQGDRLRYDFAYGLRLWPREYTSDTTWSLSGLIELNGEYRRKGEQDGTTLQKTGGHQLLLSPGLVLAGKRMTLEAGIQIPVAESLRPAEPKEDIGVVLGLRWTF